MTLEVKQWWLFIDQSFIRLLGKNIWESSQPRDNEQGSPGKAAQRYPVRIVESWSHRISWAGGDQQGSPSPSLESTQHYPESIVQMFPELHQSWIKTSFLWSLFHWLTTLSMKNLFLTFRLKLPCCSFMLFRSYCFSPERREQHFPLCHSKLFNCFQLFPFFSHCCPVHLYPH